MSAPRTSTHPDLAEALRECRRAFGSVALVSGVVNLLMLAGPLYMLQIYDRVLSSRSVPTLVALSLFLVGAYAFQGALDLIRSRVVVRSATLLDQWDPERLGGHIGFLSQTVELFDGTIAENIARMSVAPDADAVLRAARAAGAHDMILRIPSGYDTPIGEGGEALSGGQRQRIALARALYGDPFLVVLDEPSSNLDSEGEAALRKAIVGLKARGAVVVLIAHRPSAVSVCDHILVLANGAQKDFGPREAILSKITPRSVPPAAAAGNLKIVSDTMSGGRQ